MGSGVGVGAAVGVGLGVAVAEITESAIPAAETAVESGAPLTAAATTPAPSETVSTPTQAKAAITLCSGSRAHRLLEK